MINDISVENVFKPALQWEPVVVGVPGAGGITSYPLPVCPLPARSAAGLASPGDGTEENLQSGC